MNSAIGYSEGAEVPEDKKILSFRPFMYIKDLDVGDIIRSKSTGTVYVITANYHSRAIAVRTIDVTNPAEWEVLK